MKRVIQAAAALLLLGAAFGCQQPNSSAKTISSFEDTQKVMSDARQEVTETLAAVNQLKAATDIREPYKDLVSHTEKLEKQAAKVRETAADMAAREAEYQTQWEKDVQTISNPDLRATAEQRRAAVRANYQKIRDEAAEVRKAYGPFLASLKDLQTYLKNDMTPAGVKGASSTMQKINANGTDLGNKLDALNARLASVAQSMSPVNPK